MGKKYANPQISEAVCEFRLSPDSKWDLTIPGLIYEKVCKDFPHKEQRLIQEVRLIQDPEGLQQQTHTSERILFLTNNRKTFIQVGSHFLSINRLKPYSTWEQFKPNIEKAFSALKEIIDVKELQRIGLRYINRFEIPGHSVNLDDYFGFRPFLVEDLPQDMMNFSIRCLLPFFDERDTCRLNLTNAVPEKPGNTGFLLDLDYSSAPPQTVSAKKALGWVEAAHQQVEQVFEACITDRLRAILEEAS